MEKSKVDQIIDNLITLTKPEVRELLERVGREHSVFLTFSVPTDKVGGTITEGFLLKEADDKLRIGIGKRRIRLGIPENPS